MGTHAFHGPIQLSGDAASPLHAVPKQQLDAAITAHEAASDPHPGYTTTAELDTAIAASYLGVRYLTSARFVVPDGARSTLQMLSAVEYACPIWFGNSGTIVRAAIEVTIAGTAGTVIRLGLRAHTGYLPGAVIGSSATVAADAITTAIEATVSWAVTPGLYFLTATAQSTGATLPTVRATSGNLAPVSIGSAASALGAAPLAGYLTAATVTGELPGTYTISNRSGAPPLVTVRS